MIQSGLLNQKTLIKMKPEATTQALECLGKCTVEGMIVKLPIGQLDKAVYAEVKKRLELIGGTWKGGKVYGFVFPSDPTELLAQVAGGEARNIKKECQFFGTPEGLADELVSLAEIKIYHSILEPSAGQGAIVRATQKELGGPTTVWGYELIPLNQTFLNKITGFRLLGADFLACDDTSFDRIIANPPFSKNQDIDHIYKMYECLKSGGRLVSIASKHWQLSGNKKETEFREWLEKVGAEVHEIPLGAFKESGTNVASVIIVIDK